MTSDNEKHASAEPLAGPFFIDENGQPIGFDTEAAVGALRKVIDTMQERARSRDITVFRKLMWDTVPAEMHYYYLTERDGVSWAARIDNDVVENGQPFVWDDNPAGEELAGDTAVAMFFDPAVPIGHIDAEHHLHITARWQTPEGWIKRADGLTTTTPGRWVGAPEESHQATRYDANDQPYAVPCRCAIGEDHASRD